MNWRSPLLAVVVTVLGDVSWLRQYDVEHPFPSGLLLYRDGLSAQVAAFRFYARRRATHSFKHARIRRFPRKEIHS
jgi:hypothetical protein